MVKILHFADAHIDMANYGRRDPETGLPMRVVDFLKSLDVIIDTAVTEKVDMVIFAGDAYKDRSPAPTFQREWGKRIMRLSRAGIMTLLLVGNHDLSPALGRANAIEEFNTLQVPHVRVIDRPMFLKPDDLEGLPVQVMAMPWISRSGLMAHLTLSGTEPEGVFEQLESRIEALMASWFDEADPAIPSIMTAHCSVQGAKFGVERTVMLGADLVLPGSLVRDPRLDYVALGHIHKPQNINENRHPPVIYPGSIERVDFGEVGDEKFFILAEVERGKTEVTWQKLEGIRPFIDLYCALKSNEDVTGQVRAVIPDNGLIKDAIVRLTISYPREWESLIDERALRDFCAEAFDFNLVRRPQMDARIRLPEDRSVGSLTPLELLDLYWKANHTSPEESEALHKLAKDILSPRSPEA